MISKSVLGDSDEARAVQFEYIDKGRTCEFPNTKGDSPCQGVRMKSECPQSNCGFCYGQGTNNDRTMAKSNAWSFRMLSDYWAFDGTEDARCPERGQRWTWNDYRPVLGENSWAQLIAPLQVAFIKYGTISAIPSDDFSIALALRLLPSLKKSLTCIGGVSYAPYNTFNGERDTGFDVSTENNASLLGGLKMLKYLLQTKGIHLDKLPDINLLITNIQNYILLSYDPVNGYFRQGGSLPIWPESGCEFTWAPFPIAFAVDCQTWVMSVISPKVIDAYLVEKQYAGSSLTIWKKTKELGGYRYNVQTGQCDGLGFTVNTVDQVFSGEWTLGAINMLRIFANEYTDSSFMTEATFMRDAIERDLTKEGLVDDWYPDFGVNYANKRYFIPFGWWANPVLSTASTGWAVLMDKDYNPFYLGGQYKVNYSL
jgi:hypothetical protein